MSEIIKLFKEGHRYTCWLEGGKLFVADDANFTLDKAPLTIINNQMSEELLKEVEEILDRGIEGVVVSKGAIHRVAMKDAFLALISHERAEAVEGFVRFCNTEDVMQDGVSPHDIWMQNIINISKKMKTK